MSGKLKAIALVVSVASSFSGCAPKESFSWIDRHCFVADWTNHHSCVSCCRNGPCGQAYPKVEYEMLVLGNQPAFDNAMQVPVAEPNAADVIADPGETISDER